MNAIQYIKNHGVKKARGVVGGALEGHNKFDVDQNKTVEVFKTKANLVDLRHLNHLVESVDLVKSYGGIINAKHDVGYLDLDWDYDTPRVTRLKQAIADYEAIGGEHV